jgi:hypothetical protein
VPTNLAVHRLRRGGMYVDHRGPVKRRADEKSLRAGFSAGRFNRAAVGDTPGSDIGG